MGILIGADLVATEPNEALFSIGDATTLLGENLFEIVKKADYRIFNLEVPLTDTISPIEKCGPSLAAPTSAINGYKAMNVDLLTLANNHILDQGVQGLHSTCSVLKGSGISYVGVGNAEEASKPYYFNLYGKKFGVYACAEHEFSIVTNQNEGANPFEPLRSLDHVAEMKGHCDFAIVLYHGGKEYYRYPSPNLQKVCRRFVDKGANLVVCQHSHCIGCEEKYGSGTIVYGQGNFLFDHSESEFWQTSLLIHIAEDMSISYLPLRKNGNKVRLAEKEDASEILDAFFARSAEIMQVGFVEKKYEEFARSMIENYLFAISGINRNFVFKIFNKLSKGKFRRFLLKKRYKKKLRLTLQNYLQCEAHSELFLYGLKNFKTW